MPEKVLFKWQPSVVAEREAAFQLILHSIQKSFILMWQPEVLEFLGFQDVDGSLFQANFKRDVKTYLELGPYIPLIQITPRFGSRSAKGYAWIGEVKSPNLLSVVAKENAFASLTNDTIASFFGVIFESIQHPFIYPVEHSEYNKEKDCAFILRLHSTEGSIKDLIHKKEPNGTYLSRYLNPLNEGLNLQDIRIYGRQILEAIKFLISLEIPVLHLHTGNIILSQGVCRLTDFENAVLGLTPHYYHQIKYWNRCVTCEDVTVFLFGVVLFEMATGSEFHVTSYDISRIQSEILREITSSILSPSTNLPSVQDLLTLPFFREVQLNEQTLAKGDTKQPKLRDITRPLKKQAEYFLANEKPLPNNEPDTSDVSDLNPPIHKNFHPKRSSKNKASVAFRLSTASEANRN